VNVRDRRGLTSVHACVGGGSRPAGPRLQVPILDRGPCLQAVGFWKADAYRRAPTAGTYSIGDNI
jgi:hypothetical protein